MSLPPYPENCRSFVPHDHRASASGIDGSKSQFGELFGTWGSKQEYYSGTG
ncbi:hypothetical protein M407DRAFT_33264 [Tulasnella calospora MUT 4182]|uniref:Uncharacterized protein n=1 Tax=Tulasnella calospora MUT 4182 TaxID=1051891 RepID=A0A0C3K6R5_9AGAM|nr:hypothetical protein M407DRAFT_33264 [Tulasnella calospora MUT 4182]